MRPRAHSVGVDRAKALDEEIQFWRSWFQAGGLRWPYDFQARFNLQEPLQQYVATWLDRGGASHAEILDVGAGPITKLGKTHPTITLRITATDLLAAEYDRLLGELGVEPPVRTIFADGERLADQFGVDTFDLVHAQNCLDHMVNPLLAMEQMVAVTKPGGFVVLYHAEDEGRREGYLQLHQWDFRCEQDAFIIRDRQGRKTDVTRHFEARCEVECLRIAKHPERDTAEDDRHAALFEPGYEVAILVGMRKRLRPHHP